MLIRTLSQRLALPCRNATGTLSDESFRHVSRSRFRCVVLALSRRNYATPAKPKKGSIGETAKRGRVPRPATTSTTKKSSTSTPSANTQPKLKKPAKKTTEDESKTKKPKKVAAPSAAVLERRAARVLKAQGKKDALAAKKKERAQSKRAKAKSQALKIRVRDLKQQALEPPKVGTGSGWLVFWTSKCRDNPESVNNRDKLQSTIKIATQEYRSLSESDRDVGAA